MNINSIPTAVERTAIAITALWDSAVREELLIVAFELLGPGFAPPDAVGFAEAWPDAGNDIDFVEGAMVLVPVACDT
jgi:hypothetical protein